MCKNKILLYIIILYNLIIFNCNKNNVKPLLTSINGKVLLEDTNDFSNIWVYIYNTINIDTSLKNINNNYPDIGLLINQETEFNYENKNPLYKTLTNVNGEWRIDNILPGNYNIVFYKNNYGKYYIYNYNINKLNKKINDIMLYKTKIIKGILDSTLILKKFHTYILEGDFYINIGGKLIIEPNTIILAKEMSKIIVKGEIFADGNGGIIKFLPINSNVKWKGILFENSPKVFRNIILQGAISGLFFKKINIELKDIIIKNNINGIILSNIRNDIKMNNLILNNNKYGIIENLSNLLLINNSIFINNNISISIKNSNCNIINSYILKNNVGIINEVDSYLKIINSIFKKNKNIDIGNYDKTKLILKKSIINSDSIGLLFERTSTHSGAVTGEITENALVGKKIIIKLFKNLSDVNAENNWWNTNNIKEIEEKIYDKNDIPLSDTLAYRETGIVYFSNFLQQKPINIGIQN